MPNNMMETPALPTPTEADRKEFNDLLHQFRQIPMSNVTIAQAVFGQLYLEAMSIGAHPKSIEEAKTHIEPLVERFYETNPKYLEL